MKSCPSSLVFYFNFFVVESLRFLNFCSNSLRPRGRSNFFVVRGSRLPAQELKDFWSTKMNRRWPVTSNYHHTLVLDALWAAAVCIQSGATICMRICDNLSFMRLHISHMLVLLLVLSGVSSSDFSEAFPWMNLKNTKHCSSSLLGVLGRQRKTQLILIALFNRKKQQSPFTAAHQLSVLYYSQIDRYWHMTDLCPSLVLP